MYMPVASRGWGLGYDICNKKITFDISLHCLSKTKMHYPRVIARKSALEKTQLSDVLITDNLF
jgi:hypothetical protein